MVYDVTGTAKMSKKTKESFFMDGILDEEIENEF